MLPTDIAEGILFANVFGGVVKRFFGDGSDGALSTSGNVTLTSTEDGALVVKQYTSLTINSGHTMTVNNRCAGLVLYVQGNCQIDGTLHMDARGGRSDQVPFAAWRPADKSDIAYLKYLPSTRFAPVGGAGGAGGRGGDADYGGAGGAGGPGRLFGGGYGGGGGGGMGLAQAGYTGGAGGAITAGVLTTVGPPKAVYPVNAGNIGGPGAGGSGGSGGLGWSGPGGAGPSGGGGGGWQTDGSSTPGATGSYPGGLIVLIIGGDLTVGAAGIVRATGGAGGAGGNRSSADAGDGGGGGGGGGGIILLFHRGSYANSGSVSAPGGAGGAGGSGGTAVAGSAGSAGTVEAVQL